MLPKRGTVDNLRIDQLQEDLAAERVRGDKQDARIDALSERMEVEIASRRRAQNAVDRWELFFAGIVHGIEQGTMPPFPTPPTKGGEPHE